MSAAADKPKLPRRAELLHQLAGKTHSRHLRALAFALAGTEDDGPAPRLLKDTFPAVLADGRKVPERFEFQFRNVLLHLKDWGRLPAHEGLHFASIRDVGMAVAGWDRNGEEGTNAPCVVGAVCTVRQLARESGRDEKTVSKVLRWFSENHWMDVGPRWRITDREEERPGWPATVYRSTVRLLHLLPLTLARELAYEDLLSLAAPQDAPPTLLPLPAAPNAPEAEPGPVRPETPVHPLERGEKVVPPKRLSLKKLVADFDLPELPDGADLRELVAPLERLCRRAGTILVPELAARLAAKAGLTNWYEAGRAARELADDADAEALAARLEGKLPTPWSLRRIVRALQKYFGKEVDWLERGPGALRARHLAAVREVQYQAEKASWATEGERPLIAPAPETSASPLSHQEQKLRFAWMFAEDDGARALAAGALRRGGFAVPGPPE
jgi:hypothetical protein